MGLFTTLITKIIGRPPAPQAGQGESKEPSPEVKAATSPQAASSAGPPAAAPPSSSPSPETVDIAAVLDALAKKNPEKLDWKKSIVDLMKLVGIDSSLSSRKELAKELHYTGDTGDSAKMNVWLHKEVLRQLAANGGKVPESLLD